MGTGQGSQSSNSTLRLSYIHKMEITGSTSEIVIKIDVDATESTQ